MFTLVLFLVSLILIILLFIMKGLEISRGRKIFLEIFFLKCDALIRQCLSKFRLWWNHVNFKNTKLVLSWIILTSKGMVIAIKRHFDHQQSHFFIKRESSGLKHKGSTSFFLKDISDYKKSLRGEIKK